MFLFIQVFEAASSYQPPNPPDIGSSVAQFHHPYQIEQDIRKTQEIIEGRKTPHTYPHPQSSFLGRVSIEELGLDEDEDAPYKSLEPYGVPFSLLCLIATTTNLITDIERCGTFPSSHLPAELEHRAQMLENGICAWGAASGRTNGKPGLVSNEAAAVACVDLSLSPRRCTLDCPDQVDLSNGPDDTGATAVPELMHRCMSTAVHHALLIYYFRTVRDTNPVILQHYVESIIDSLEEHARHKVRYAPARLNVIVWPSFIAACEAIGVTLRQRCINCLRHAAWAGFRNWEAAEGLVREVWKRRDITSSANATTSWRNVMRESGLSMVLT
jgi:arginine metabolism regulation protein II